MAFFDLEERKKYSNFNIWFRLNMHGILVFNFVQENCKRIFKFMIFFFFFCFNVKYKTNGNLR